MFGGLISLADSVGAVIFLDCLSVLLFIIIGVRRRIGGALRPGPVRFVVEFVRGCILHVLLVDHREVDSRCRPPDAPSNRPRPCLFVLLGVAKYNLFDREIVVHFTSVLSKSLCYLSVT
jgi:hypothetical protein